MPPRFRNDPAALMLAVFQDLYPAVDVILEYKPAEHMPTPSSTPLNSDDGHGDEAADLPAAGCAVFKTDGSERPEIWLNTELPIEMLPTVMAEELAHVVVGHEEQHGPAYKAVFDALELEFERRAQRLLARLVPASTYHDQPTLLLANAVSQARYALEDLNLDPRAYQIVTSARELQGQRGRRVCRIGVPFPPEQEEEIQRLLRDGRHTLVFGL